MNYVMTALGIIFALMYLRICGKQKKPLRTMLLNSAAGAVALIIVSLMTAGLEKAVSVNYITTFISVTLGIPGVLGITTLVYFL